MTDEIREAADMMRHLDEKEAESREQWRKYHAAQERIRQTETSAEQAASSNAATTLEKVTKKLQVFVAEGSAEDFRVKSDHLAQIIAQVDPANARHLKQVIEILNSRVTKLEQILADVTEAVCGSPPQSA